MARSQRGTIDGITHICYTFSVIIADKENSIFDYEGEKNTIVLPITRYVRKDGNLVAKNETTKQFFDKYSALPKKWGYMISQMVEYPTYSTSNTSLLGVPNRNHYASAPDEDIIQSSLWYLKEQALIKSDHVFYIEENNEFSKEALINFFEEVDNIVMLRKEQNNE